MFLYKKTIFIEDQSYTRVYFEPSIENMRQGQGQIHDQRVSKLRHNLPEHKVCKFLLNNGTVMLQTWSLSNIG